VSRVAIVGCGLIGDKRAHAALAAGCRIVSVADVDRRRAEQLARRLGSSPEVMIDYREVSSSAPDIVVVATPHDQLASIALAMTEAGHHVLVEKPAGRTAAEVDPILASARRRNVLVKVGFNHRFHPAMLKSREIVDSGVLGPLLFVRGRYGHGGRVGYEQEWRMRPEISGGGELIDQGMHLIDLSRWFLGDFEHVYGVAPTYFWQSAVEDNCFLCLRTVAGQVAWLHAGWTEWKNIFSFEIMGRDGKLQIDGLGGSYGPERLTHYRMLPKMGPPETTSWEFPFPDRSWELEFLEFLSAIAERRQPVGNIADGKAALEIVVKVYGEKHQ
jgi:predicted dehydrogenase